MAQKVVAVGASLILQAEETGAEHAVTFDLGSGEQLGSVLIGGAKDVDMEPHLRLMHQEGHYLAFHTHLSGASFSDLDAAVLLLNAPIRTIAVIGSGGRWYALGKIPGSPAADARAVIAMMRTTVLAVREPYRAVIAAGAMTREEAARHVLDRVWELVAPVARLRYDREDGHS